MNKDINAPKDNPGADELQPESLETAELDAADLEKVSGGIIDNKSGGGAAWTHNGTPPNILCC
jgi:hypothetical protein